MKSILEISDSNWGEWRFELFGFPVRVQPLFWLILLLLGPHEDFLAVLLWVSICLVSVLVHELGHALAFRTFGDFSEIVLYVWGGLTRPLRSSRKTTLEQILIALAGPFAGFVLGGLVVAAALASGAMIKTSFTWMIPSISAIPPAPVMGNPRLFMYQVFFWNDLLFVNFLWGLMNLLPIYPLDGGRVSRALFEEYGGYRGFRRSLLLSGLTAAFMALLGLARGDIYMLLTFGVLAASSLQARDSTPQQRNNGRWGR